MKKYIYASLFAAVLMTATSCSEDREGTEPGNDSKANVCIYQYTPTSDDGDYDADNDIRVRLAANSTASEVYVTTVQNGSSLSDDELTSKALAGQKVTLETQADGAKTADVFFTGLKGSNTIAAVAVGSKGETTLSTSEFYGKTWNVVATGVVYSRFAAGNNSWAYGYIYDVELQQDQDNQDSYRLRNVFGKGINLPINVISADDNTNGDYDSTGWAYEGSDDYFGLDMQYRYVLMPTTATGRTYTGYGDVYVGDYYSVRGSDYTYYCRMYEDYSIRMYTYWKGSSNMGTGWFYFYPQN